MNPTEHGTKDLEHLANQGANRKMGWYFHACVFILVNLGRMAMAVLSGRDWVRFPSFGWALVLLVHGLLVFVLMPGNGLRDRSARRFSSRSTCLRPLKSADAKA